MHYLITGGLGFIGSNFIRYLLKKHKDVQITNLDKISYGANPKNLKDIEKDSRYSFIKGDICDKNLINKLVKSVDLIVNFAAESHVDRSIADPIPFLKSNVEGLLTMLEAIRVLKREIRFIQVGTDESYGNILEHSFNENDSLKPSSPYAASKASADLFCKAYHKTYNLDIVITRCTNNFGPYQFPEKLIPKTIVRAHLDMKIPVYGSGKNMRDWLYVMDHCEALDKIQGKGRSGEIYNVAGGNELENIEVVKEILVLMNRPKSLIEFVEDRPGHDIRYSLESSKIKNELNWKPKYNFLNALDGTVKWYLRNISWWKEIANEQIIHPTPWKVKWQ